MRFRNILGSIAIGAPLLAALSVSASAQTVQFTFVGEDNSNTINLSSNGGTSWEDVYASRYKGQVGSSGTINILCVDANHDITSGQTYTADTSQYITNPAAPQTGSGPQVDTYGGLDGGLASAITPYNPGGTNYNPVNPTNITPAAASARASEVAWLADNFVNDTALTSNQSTALSLAVWDIVQDGGDGLGTGNLQVENWSNSSPYAADFSNFEALALSHDAYSSNSAYWIQDITNPHAQEYVYSTSTTTYDLTPTPEPSSVAAFAFTGLGLMGLLLRARKRRAAVTVTA